tara:strand:+ start:529 stop:687 length:159 start_codon:yes stop_codon:yes gene_type:complete
MTRYEEMYLEFFNEFLTIKKFAEHHDITPDEAVNIITRGKRDHYSRHKIQVK